MRPNLKEYPYFVFDTETTGLVYPVDRVFGFSITTPDDSSYYWDIRLTPDIVPWLMDQVRGYKGKIVAHHAKYDWLLCKCSGIEIPENQLHCTMITAVLINEHLYEYSLDALCDYYLGATKIVIPKGNMADLPFEVVEPYANRDTWLTHQLYKWQNIEIEREGLQDIVEFEHRVLPRICRRNAEGIRVDLDRAEQAMPKITPIILENEAKLNDIAGWELNVNSSPQVKKLFEPKEIDGRWVANDGTILGRTPNGGPSLKAEILREMKHPAAQLILDTRSLYKTRDTFLAKHILEHAIGDRVYPTINQNKGEDGGTSTGRLSYVDPAMQQIPSRNKKVAAVVKPCFLPDEGHVWVDTDQATFEVRVFAHLVNNKRVIQAYRNNPELDFHQYVSDETKLPRKAEYSGQANAKQLNLSMIFNSGNGAIAEKMGMEWEWDEFIDKHNNLVRYKRAGDAAMAIINNYHKTLPGVKELAQRAKKIAEERGYVMTFTGRRLRFPHKFKTYKASGLLIQATAADINKLNWIWIEEALGYMGRLILNTHDSYGLGIKKDLAVHGASAVKRHLEENNPMNVPVILEVNEPADNWWGSINGKRIL